MRQLMTVLVGIALLGLSACKTTEVAPNVAEIKDAYAAWAATSHVRPFSDGPRAVPWFENNAPWMLVGDAFPPHVPHYGIFDDETLGEMNHKVIQIWSVSTDRVVMTSRRSILEQVYTEYVAAYPNMRITPGLKMNEYVHGLPADYDWLSDPGIWEALLADAIRCCEITGDDRFYIMAETPMGRYWTTIDENRVPIDYRAFSDAVQVLNGHGIKFCFYPMYLVNKERDEDWSALLATWIGAVDGSYVTESYETWPYQVDNPAFTDRKELHYRIAVPQDERIICTLTGYWQGPSYGREAYDVREAKAWMAERAESEDVLIWGGTYMYLTGFVWAYVN